MQIGKYNAKTKKFTPFKEVKDENYVETINEIVYNRFVISKKILESNLAQAKKNFKEKRSGFISSDSHGPNESGKRT